ncbi:MAG: PDZ domain-containing protein [Parachlamydiales bacterium]|nr:PDZ domain-containing protein [Parachlamydiales bacterium]
MRKAIFFVLFCILSISQVTAAPHPLKFEDIPRVMERFFMFHIENKELNTTIVRRSMKLYIESFDPERAYLLDSEVSPYLNMSEKRAKEIMANLQNHDYRDFLALNGLIQESIVRAQAIRSFLAKQLVQATMDFDAPNPIPPSAYSQSDDELIGRQRNRMVRFYQYHKQRTQLDTPDRKAKVFDLFEKKAQRAENSYLFLASNDIPMTREKIENLLTLRILKSFAKSLDTHTSFFSPEEAFEMRMTLEKQFEGVGVVLSEGIDGVMIAELIKGSPAEQSGQIKVNDVLIEIDGVPTAGAPFEQVLEMLKKKDKSEIILGFMRTDAKNNQIFRVPLLKRAIVMNEERIQLGYEKVEGGIIGKITLHSFYESSEGISSEKDIKDAIRSFREKGELVGLVLDLRENSGGFLSQAVKVAGLFISNGVVVVSKYGKGEVHYLRNIVSKAFYNGPLVVLTSKMSASASEIVAQALQDFGVGLIVGDERTFGKGSIQYQTVTDANADVFFKVTVGRYYTASGKSTQIEGVKADIVVPTQYAAYKIGEKYLEYPLTQDKMSPVFVDPLSDLDEKTRKLFQLRYLPTCQRVVAFWKNMLPTLQKNSAMRMANDPAFQAFNKKLEAASARADSLPPNTVDEQIHVGKEDLQMKEAVNIVKDMIDLEAQAQMPETGTD